MKIKKEKVKDLGNIGFVKIMSEPKSILHLLTDGLSNDEQSEIIEKYYESFKENHVCENSDDKFYFYEGCYFYNLGHARRGQHYYVLIQKDLQVAILASKPDGDGTHIKVGDIFQKLISEGFIE